MLNSSLWFWRTQRSYSRGGREQAGAFGVRIIQTSRGTEFQYMSLSCCMHSDTRSEGPQTGCQNQYLNLRNYRYIRTQCTRGSGGRRGPVKWVIANSESQAELADQSTGRYTKAKLLKGNA